MRFLISPRPTSRDSAGIFVRRVVKELRRRGYSYTSFPFHCVGRSMLPWTHAFVMGMPKYYARILGDRRPSVYTLGQPYDPNYLRAVGIPPNADHEYVLRCGLSILESSRKVVFISRYVRDVWQRIAQEQNVQFPHPSEYRVIYHALD